MKKICKILLLGVVCLIVPVAVAFAGCTPKNNNGNNQGGPETPTVPVEPTPTPSQPMPTPMTKQQVLDAMASGNYQTSQWGDGKYNPIGTKYFDEIKYALNNGIWSAKGHESCLVIYHVWGVEIAVAMKNEVAKFVVVCEAQITV